MGRLERLGRYTLLRPLGSGGMGEVFLALREGEARSVARPYAVKRLLPALVRNPEAVKLWLDEIRLVEVLEHPNIVRILEAAEDRGAHYLVMEYVNGMSVRQLVDRHRVLRSRMPPRLACQVALQVAEALGYAHAACGPAGQPLHLVHRDVSPRNILCSTLGEVKLIDFGVAKSEQQEHLSVAGRLKGKREYMSPEQSLGRPLDGRSDLFSLAIVLLEMLTGRNPFAQPAPDSTLQAIRAVAFEPVARVDGRLAPLDPFLLRALAKQPEERFPDGATWAAALREAVARLPPSSVKLDRLVCGLADEAVDEISRSLVSAESRLREDPSISDVSLLLAEELERTRASRKRASEESTVGGRGKG